MNIPVLRRGPRPRKRLLVVATAVALTASLAACGGSDGGSGGSKTLTILLWNNEPALNAVADINKKFEADHPGVKVRVSSAPIAGSAYDTLVTSQLNAGDADVVGQFASTPSLAPPKDTGINSGGTIALMQAGQLEDLSGESFMENYDKDFQEFANGMDGKIYGLAAAAYAIDGNLVYNPDLLKKYGVAVPTTFDEFIQACETLKAGGLTPLFVAAKDNAMQQAFTSIFLQTMVGSATSAEGVDMQRQLAQDFYDGKINFDSPEFEEVADKYLKVMSFANDNANSVGLANQLTDWGSKAESDYPFLLLGSWSGPVIEASNPDLKFEMMTLPGTNDPATNRMIINPDLSWVVPTGSKNVDLAKEWLATFSEPENYKAWLEQTGSVSTQPNQSTSLPWAGYLNDHLDGALSGQHPLVPWVPAGAPLIAGGPNSPFSTVLQVMEPFGDQSADEALSNAAEAYTSAIKSQ